MPADDMPADDMKADDMSADDMPADDIPADDMPADDMPADDMPADDIPADDMPADDMPVDDMPVEFSLGSVVEAIAQNDFGQNMIMLFCALASFSIVVIVYARNKVATPNEYSALLIDDEI